MFQTAVSGSESSVWGGTEQAAVLTDELALKTLTTLHYLTDLTGRRVCERERVCERVRECV